MRTRLSLAARGRVASLLSKTLAEYPPPGYHCRAANPSGAVPLGDYLLSLGYIAPTHLTNALRTQRQAAQQGSRPLLGDILVRAQVVHPRVLTTTLLLQMVDRLLDPAWTPEMLGEQLVLGGILAPADLAPAFQLQTWLRQAGTPARLGDLLLQQGMLTQQQLSDVLDAQQRRFQADRATAATFPSR